MSPSRVEMLQRMPIFGAIREEALNLLLDHSRLVECGTGAHFFHEGDPASSMFVLEAGSALVIKSWRHDDYVLHELHAGDCFGEMALMDLHPRSASVRAIEDCRAIEFASTDLLHLFESDKEQFALIQMNIGREVCRRLRATDELLFHAMMGELPTRPQPLDDRP